jgi:TetR/AcrR family transcriptional regulator, transcriptional repressor for nem operon
MRYKAGQKEETRKKMLEAAGRGFRSHGYDGIGVDGLAKEAGVTSGAFYSHFGSKDGAFKAALEAGLDEVIATLPKIQRENGKDWIKAFADYYLGRDHRADLACGCAMATLTPEVVRSGSELHVIYEQKMSMIADLIAAGLAGGSKVERRARAWAMLGVLIGGLTVARAMDNMQTADEVANAIKIAAQKAAGETHILG